MALRKQVAAILLAIGAGFSLAPEAGAQVRSLEVVGTGDGIDLLRALNVKASVEDDVSHLIVAVDDFHVHARTFPAACRTE